MLKQRWTIFIVAIQTITTTITEARFPPHVPPYNDTCRGLNQPQCVPSSANGPCAWYEDQYPWCFNKDYAKLQPQVTQDIGLSSTFFTFNSGVHLSEGTQQKIIYNLTPDECAAQCLKSAGLCPNNIRCLSFDFYPFETPLTTAPWFESAETGVCVLNDENSNSARLRNSDLGYTDASLYYRSHFSYLPFADTEGYYEVRDPRGGGLSYMLNYGAYNTELSATVNVWGGSRWGIFHYWVPPPLGYVVCPLAEDASIQEDYQLPRYYGGYTPVNEYQKCPGLVSFTESDALCVNTGGRMCSETELQVMVGYKLGCGYDGPVRGTNTENAHTLVSYPLWSEEDRGTEAATSGKKLKFPRCCANYAQTDSCDVYKFQGNYCAFGSNEPYCPYTECSRYKHATDCINYASGTAKQRAYGMGIYLDNIRQNCTQLAGSQSCQGMIVQEWAPRDHCVWCPTQGGLDGGGAGECRPGSSLGICKNSPSLLQEQWANTVRTHSECQPFGETICRLVQFYSDLASVLEHAPVPLNATSSPTLTGLPNPFCYDETTGAMSTPPTLTPPLPTFSPTHVKTEAPSFPVQVPTTSVGGASTGSSSSPTTTTFNGPTSQVDCSAYENVPSQCKATSGCKYDAKKHLCLAT